MIKSTAQGAGRPVILEGPIYNTVLILRLVSSRSWLISCSCKYIYYIYTNMYPIDDFRNE